MNNGMIVDDENAQLSFLLVRLVVLACSISTLIATLCEADIITLQTGKIPDFSCRYEQQKKLADGSSLVREQHLVRDV